MTTHGDPPRDYFQASHPPDHLKSLAQKCAPRVHPFEALRPIPRPHPPPPGRSPHCPAAHTAPLCFRLSGSDLPGEEWLDYEKHGHRRSVIRRVKRFLSAHEHPGSPRGRRYARQASDSSAFFLPPGDLSPARDLLDVPSRSPRRAPKPLAPDGGPALHSSLGELSTIRETSRTSTLQSLTPQTSLRASPGKMPQVPEVRITAPGPAAEDLGDSSASLQSFEFTGVQAGGPGQPGDPLRLMVFPSGEGTPPRAPSPQPGSAPAEPDLFPFAPGGADPFANDPFPKRWSLPGFLESSHTSLEARGPEPPLLLDPETSSETSGINFVAGPRASPDLLYLMATLDTKETDIVELNNERTDGSPGGKPASPSA